MLKRLVVDDLCLFYVSEDPGAALLPWVGPLSDEIALIVTEEVDPIPSIITSIWNFHAFPTPRMN